MSLEIFNKKNNKEQLQYYKQILENFSKQCNNNTILNEHQKLKLDNYINRAINYCSTRKYIVYPNIKWKQDKKVLSTVEQLKVYKDCFEYINTLIKQIHSDPLLSLKCKRELTDYLGCIHCHLRGKLNRKIY